MFFFNSRLLVVVSVTNLRYPPPLLRDVKDGFVMWACEFPSSSPPWTSFASLGTAGWTSGRVGCCCLFMVMMAPAGTGCHPPPLPNPGPLCFYPESCSGQLKLTTSQWEFWLFFPPSFLASCSLYLSGTFPSYLLTPVGNTLASFNASWLLLLLGPSCVLSLFV